MTSDQKTTEVIPVVAGLKRKHDHDHDCSQGPKVYKDDARLVGAEFAKMVSAHLLSKLRSGGFDRSGLLGIRDAVMKGYSRGCLLCFEFAKGSWSFCSSSCPKGRICYECAIACHLSSRGYECGWHKCGECSTVTGSSSRKKAICYYCTASVCSSCWKEEKWPTDAMCPSCAVFEKEWKDLLEKVEAEHKKNQLAEEEVEAKAAKEVIEILD